jgi:hypothetical protein
MLVGGGKEFIDRKLGLWKRLNVIYRTSGGFKWIKVIIISSERCGELILLLPKAVLVNRYMRRKKENFVPLRVWCYNMATANYPLPFVQTHLSRKQTGVV